ncbi:MAG TPA: homoserine kinase [Polyangia bacterium]|nr:homoserine kinase [Polyangia bacterium]
MAEFRTLSADDVREILDGFEALGASSYRSHAPVAAGTINTNVRVETAAGPVFLRINEGKTRDDVTREAAIVSHAAARGVPTPAPLYARDGEWFEDWRGELASVFPWVPGRTLTRAAVGPAHAALVGEALARLHLASAGYADHRPGRYEPDEIRARVERVARLARPELLGAASVLGLALDGLARERAATLPLGIIHGDLFIDNVLYEDGDGAPRLAALLDFEQASWGRLAYDLAVTTLAFAYGRDDFRPDVTRALLEAYAAVRAPSDDERRAFGAELRFAACRFATTRITDVHLKRDAGAPAGKDFRRYLARLASVDVHLASRDGLLELP